MLVQVQPTAPILYPINPPIRILETPAPTLQLIIYGVTLGAHIFTAFYMGVARL
jgi:threonine/homoserine efflux transporter RhtA